MNFQQVAELTTTAWKLEGYCDLINPFLVFVSPAFKFLTLRRKLKWIIAFLVFSISIYSADCTITAAGVGAADQLKISTIYGADTNIGNVGETCNIIRLCPTDKKFNEIIAIADIQVKGQEGESFAQNCFSSGFAPINMNIKKTNKKIIKVGAFSLVEEGEEEDSTRNIDLAKRVTGAAADRPYISLEIKNVSSISLRDRIKEEFNADYLLTIAEKVQFTYWIFFNDGSTGDGKFNVKAPPRQDNRFPWTFQKHLEDLRAENFPAAHAKYADAVAAINKFIFVHITPVKCNVIDATKPDEFSFTIPAPAAGAAAPNPPPGVYNCMKIKRIL